MSSIDGSMFMPALKRIGGHVEHRSEAFLSDDEEVRKQTTIWPSGITRAESFICITYVCFFYFEKIMKRAVTDIEKMKVFRVVAEL